MDSWYYAQGAQQLGPVTVDRLRQLIFQGVVRPGDLVWREGMENWLEAGRVAELGVAFSTSVVPPAMPPIPPAMGAGGFAPPPGYGAYPPGAYPPGAVAPGYYGGYVVPQSYKWLAIVSLILAFLFPLGGLVAGIIALAMMRKSGNPEGKGMAVAGVVVSGAFFAFVILCIVIAIAAGS